MDFLGVDIVCPACHGELERRGHDETGSMRCLACGREYPVLVGIPDLRLWPDPYIGMDADRDKGAMLARACADRSFLDAVHHYYSVTAAVPEFQARRFVRGLAVSSERSRESLQQWEELAPGDVARLSLLDVGCGTAPFLVHAAQRYGRVAGVDVAFRWLVLARRRLAEAGVRAPLICACAEALPFRDVQFDRVVADSTLEHLRDARAATAELFRTMRPGGILFVATPNRYSLGPDPHVGLPAGGWLPDALVAAYVRRKGGIPPQRSLLSRGALRRLLEQAGFAATSIHAPRIPEALRNGLGVVGRRVVTLYNAALRVAPARFALERVGPLLHAVARRPPDEDPLSCGADAAILTRSRAVDAADRSVASSGR